MTGPYTEDQVDVNSQDVKRFGDWTYKGKKIYYKESEGLIKSFKDSGLKKWKDL